MPKNSAATIQKAIANLRQLVQQEVQHCWHDLGNKLASSASSQLAKYPTAILNEKGYIVFPSRQEVRWLGQQITIPQTLEAYSIAGLSLRLVLTWWAADAQIFINGELVQQGDLFDSSARVLITDHARPGQEYLLTIRLVSPNHDIGALMRSHLIYEQVNTPQKIDPGLVADEITVLSKYLSQFKPTDLDILATELDRFNWHNLEQADKFTDDLAQLRSSLLPLAQDFKQRRFNLLGHAHLDMAWLWTTDETYEVAERTFKSVLNLQQDFPSLTFGHTSPALYEWMENNRPELFELIQNAVKSNRWEILGGMWVEPETNLVCGESLIRQLVYGQQYYQEKFGEITKVAWLPDSFGFTWQLPQIMQQCGIEYFVTGKLHWNDTTKFPHGCFWWESPDGTQLLTLMSPPNVTGVMDTNPITMINYAVAWEAQTGLQEIFWLPGVGDHGGGPTRDMLEVAAKWHNSPFFPQIEFATAADYLERISCVRGSEEKSFAQSRQGAEDRVKTLPQFPVWQDELYLELHRGCYTVHGDQKKYNRRCERLLYEAELWSTLATLLCGDKFDIQPLFSNIGRIIEKEDLCQVDPQQLIEIAWKKVLFNQFHDILPGTSIAEVFTQANRDWETAFSIGENLLRHALNTIALNIELPQAPQADAVPIVVFNSLNWSRSQIVTLEDSRFNHDTQFLLWDTQGNNIVANSYQAGKLSFLAQDISGVGYSLYWLGQSSGTRSRVEFKNNYLLENNHLKVIVNPQTGDLDSIFDKIEQREILRSPGNKLQAFADRGQYWDAWNIDPEYPDKQLSDTQLKSIEWLEDSELRQVIRVVKQFNNSKFIQDYILEKQTEKQANLLTIKNTVDWQETHVMIKVAFPLNLISDYGTYEIPCGTIKRTTKPETAADKAKWEVPALNWADLTDTKANYGVSLLNDGKYGYDAQPDQLRLTLLRAATWPDPQSDRGIHHFTYCIYPHQGNWQKAHTVHKGYELNTNLHIVILPQPEKQNEQNSQQLVANSELFNLSADNLILMALQLSNQQNSTQNLTMRCYEAFGTTAKVNLRSDLDLELEHQIDCLGNKIKSEQINLIKPHKISNFKLKFKYQFKNRKSNKISITNP